MNIPTKHISYLHATDTNDISWMIWKASENNRAGARDKIAERLLTKVPTGFDFITSGLNKNSVEIGIKVAKLTGGALPFVYPTAISQTVAGGKLLRNSRIILISDTVENARKAYARLMLEFPLVIKVVSFLG